MLELTRSYRSNDNFTNIRARVWKLMKIFINYKLIFVTNPHIIEIVSYNSFVSIQLKLAECQDVEELMNLHGPNQI